MNVPHPAPAIEVVSEECQQTLIHYRQQQAEIEAAVWRTLANGGIADDHLRIANANLARNIMAALSLGNLDFLGNDISWLEGLLANYRLPQEPLRRYLYAYRKALKTYLEDWGTPILNWMAQLTANSA